MAALFQFDVPADGGMGYLTQQVTDLLADVEQGVRDALADEAPDQNYALYWSDDGELLVELDESQAESEYGTPSVAMRPAVRNALLKASSALHSKLVFRA